MNRELIQKQLDAANKEFRQEKSGIIAEILSLDTMEIFIEIEWGDWKHEHGYANYVMQKYGFKKIREEITEENGDDCYSSVHYYKFIGNPKHFGTILAVDLIV